MLIAFDGTWDDQSCDTNVLKFFKAYDRTAPGRNLYIEGVGTRVSALGHLAGGIFGAGEGKKVDEAIDWLRSASVTATEPQIVDIVGFSRGAATALDFANRLHKQQRAIRFIGLWDTVAAFGVANLGWYFSKLTFGHHLTLPPSGITHCVHAMAIDERRPPFAVTRIDGAHEVWFRGVHGDIGGGSNLSLSNLTLRWMLRKAAAAGLPITEADALALAVNDRQLVPTFDVSEKIGLQRRAVRPTDRVHYSVANYSVNPRESREDERQAQPVALAARAAARAAQGV